MASRSSLLALSCLALLVGIIIGVLIGHFTSRSSQDQRSLLNQMRLMSSDAFTRKADVTDDMLKMVDSDNIRDNLRELSKEPHLAGSDRDHQLAMYIRDRWLEAGIDDAQLVQYEVLLSHPSTSKRNTVTLLDANGSLKYQSASQEKDLRSGDAHPDFIKAFNAYTPAGEFTGDLVYVNYGRIEDFEELKSLGISVEGYICIARYGKIFRGNKVKNCHDNGGKAMILYSDPQDVAVEGTDPEDVYPNSFWLPGTGMQRGSTFIGHGDPLTPNYPSLDEVYRIPKDEAHLPKIPCQPIGYEDAKEFLKFMGGQGPPTNWTGGLEDVPYNLGPGFNDANRRMKVEIKTHNILKRFKSYNVIGRIDGEFEPDRYILHGNHRDAWGYGAVDPSSGTAELLETVRVLGKLKQDGWRPRRTIVFCSWGAEEYGLIGSTEWVEEVLPALTDRGVSYLNNDICVSGPEFSVHASPLLDTVVRTSAKKVESPQKGYDSMYDMWKVHERNRTEKDEEPEVGTLGSGSDHAPFAFFAGVSSVSFWFRRDRLKYNISIYPAYHTGYETFYLVDKHIDPGFIYHKACSQLSIVMLRHMADSLFLPCDVENFANRAIKALEKFKEEKNAKLLRDAEVSLDKLEKKAKEFAKAAKKWEEEMSEVDKNNPIEVRARNDQCMSMERVFIMSDGLPGRPDTRHALFAPSKFDSYASAGLPGISDLLHKFEELEFSEKQKRKRELNIHVSRLYVMFHQAVQLLRPTKELL